jgi:hypothetical protein
MSQNLAQTFDGKSGGVNPIALQKMDYDRK